jgi:hypothetical protein
MTKHRRAPVARDPNANRQHANRLPVVHAHLTIFAIARLPLLGRSCRVQHVERPKVNHEAVVLDQDHPGLAALADPVHRDLVLQDLAPRSRLCDLALPLDQVPRGTPVVRRQLVRVDQIEADPVEVDPVEAPPVKVGQVAVGHVVLGVEDQLVVGPLVASAVVVRENSSS